MKRRRYVSEEERALWTSVTRAIKPLRPSASVPKPEPKKAQAMAPPPPPLAASRLSPPARGTIKPPAPASLDRKSKQRIARGRDGIDARIDLHGMTQQRAHTALLGFLRNAQASGARIALVVTGKGTVRSATAREHERGILRRQVPLWLALPEFRPFVAGFEEAHLRHGGEGALYLRLRRGS